jgi:hypothetical protein
VLYRADKADEPYFGRGSYWTPHRRFAETFGDWLQHYVRDEQVLYRAEVEIGDYELLNLSEPWTHPAMRHLPRSNTLFEVPSAAVTDGRIEKFSALGIRWIAFRGKPTGILVDEREQYVYCGTEPITAELCEVQAE